MSLKYITSKGWFGLVKRWLQDGPHNFISLGSPKDLHRLSFLIVIKWSAISWLPDLDKGSRTGISNWRVKFQKENLISRSDIGTRTHICGIMFVCFVCLMVFSATLNNILVISWQSVLLVKETRGPGENHRPVASLWQTLSHNVLHLVLNKIRTHKHKWW